MEELEFINRGLILVIPQKPFFDWINYLDPDFPISPTDIEEHNSYLVEEDLADLDKVLKNHFKRIFERELLGMWTVVEDWPQDRSFKVFKEWFDCKMSALVFDLVDSPIIYR